ncbi:polysaccharide deacetylase family protein [Thermoflavimicrobium dichotomicum]|uniref:Polysaccharide deacetylase n=1 Tax=Thermoflavimicrobium dichotomicum TaxID=46223 RepID=A0A1I3JLG5_9BACL|nr:polysaccharide deacetylase family protein [Thermoflavimicrobium dichotomicum]SFI61101.1 Polysaccharide deacetylase [Thermoflavimicrobium dichotomicum]
MSKKFYLFIALLIIGVVASLAIYLQFTPNPSASTIAKPPAKKTGYQPYKHKNLAPYNGPVEHLFFHPLIAYPKKAFRGDFQSKEMDKWFVTIPEFHRILDSLYKRNFILVNINDVYGEIEKNGEKVIERKKLMVPKGKKPIIISIDDLNYYQENHIDYGTVSKLVLDKNGEIATLSVDEQGRKVISKNNEIVPILDDFVKKHPDFSLNGAKGTINLTGYEGILGYRTNVKKYNPATRQFDLDNPQYQKEREAVKPIIKRLKETGWNFASHSYHHRDHSKITLEKLIDDSTKWKKEVESLVGPTKIYVYPFGASIPAGDPRIEHLYKMGFRIFQPVGSQTYEEYHGKMLFIDRRHADGIGLRKQAHLFTDLYDAKSILDTKNRPANPGY